MPYEPAFLLLATVIYFRNAQPNHANRLQQDRNFIGIDGESGSFTSNEESSPSTPGTSTKSTLGEPGETLVSLNIASGSQSFISDQGSSPLTPEASEEDVMAHKSELHASASATTARLTTLDHGEGSISASGPLSPPERHHMKAKESSNLLPHTFERYDEDLAMVADKIDNQDFHMQTAKPASVIKTKQLPLGIVERTEKDVPPEKPDNESRLVKGIAGKNVESIADDEGSPAQIDLTASPAPDNSRVVEVENLNQPIPMCLKNAEKGRKRTYSEVSETAEAGRTDAEYRLKRHRKEVQRLRKELKIENANIDGTKTNRETQITD